MTAATGSRIRLARTDESTIVLGDARAAAFRAAPVIALSDRRVKHIERLRVVTKPGRDTWTVHEVWGSGSDHQELFQVDLGVKEIPRQGFTWALINIFKEQGRYTKIMGLFDKDHPEVLVKEW